MNIEVITEDKNIGTINCKSMYEAHTWIVFLEARGHKCETFINEISQTFPNNLQNPITYKPKSK